MCTLPLPPVHRFDNPGIGTIRECLHYEMVKVGEVERSICSTPLLHGRESNVGLPTMGEGGQCDDQDMVLDIPGQLYMQQNGALL